MSGKGLLIYTAFIFVIGGWAGQVLDSEPEYKVIHVKPDKEIVTKVETLPAPPAITKTVVPQECINAAEIAHKEAMSAVDLNSRATRVLDIMGELRQAAVLQDLDKINELDTELRAIQSKSVDAVLEISTEGLEYNDNYETCKEKAND